MDYRSAWKEHQILLKSIEQSLYGGFERNQKREKTANTRGSAGSNSVSYYGDHKQI
jgi:hypothetical protein